MADIRQGIRGHKVFSIEAKLVHWTEWTSAANNLPAGAVTSLPPAVANDPLVWVALVHGELSGVNGPSPVTWEAVALDANTGTDQGAYTQAENPNEPPFFMKLSDLSHGGC